MSAVFLKISPVLLAFALGLLLRRTGIFSKVATDQFLRLFYYVAAPALFFTRRYSRAQSDTPSSPGCNQRHADLFQQQGYHQSVRSDQS